MPSKPKYILEGCQRLSSILVKLCVGTTFGLTAVFTLSVAQAAIPLKIVDKLPYIPVQIDGKTFLMLLDLGADDTVAMAPKTLSAVHLESVAGANRHTNTKGEVIVETRLRIPELRIGMVTFTQVEASEQRFAPDYHPPDVSRGHIGLGLLKDYKIALDYRHGKMWLIDSRSPADEQSHCRGVAVARLPRARAIMLTHVQTDRGELTMVWDTGSQSNVLRDPNGKPAASDGAEPPRVQLRRFALGGINFGPVKLYAVNFQDPAEADAAVGYEFFAKHSVCFDVTGQQLLVSQ